MEPLGFGVLATVPRVSACLELQVAVPPQVLSGGVDFCGGVLHCGLPRRRLHLTCLSVEE